MSWCNVRPLAKRNADHLTLGLLCGFADRFRNFFRFTFAKADAAFLVANNDEGGKTKALTTFYSFGNTVDRDQTVSKFWCASSRRPRPRFSRSAMWASLYKYGVDHAFARCKKHPRSSKARHCCPRPTI